MPIHPLQAFFIVHCFQMLMIHFLYPFSLKKTKKTPENLYCSAQCSPFSLFELPQSTSNSSEMRSNKLCWQLFYVPDPKIRSSRWKSTVLMVAWLAQI